MPFLDRTTGESARALSIRSVIHNISLRASAPPNKVSTAVSTAVSQLQKAACPHGGTAVTALQRKQVPGVLFRHHTFNSSRARAETDCPRLIVAPNPRLVPPCGKLFERETCPVAGGSKCTYL